MRGINAWFNACTQSAFWLAATLGLAGSAVAHAADVNISLHGQVVPGLHGHIRVGEPERTVIYHEPVRVYHQPVYHHPTTEVRYYPAPVYVQPIIIHAPKQHRRHWKKHCHAYHACGSQVQFVDVYEAPRYRSQSRESYGYGQSRAEVREERRHYHQGHH